MRKLFFATIMIACAASFSFAQSGDDYNKYDVYAGFSHNRVDFSNATGDHEGFNGFEVSAKGNISRYVGLKGDYSFHRKSFGFGNSQSFIDANLHNVLGGLELKDNSTETRIKPFAHALAGIAHAKVDVDPDVCAAVVGAPCPVVVDSSETGFAAAFGGGVDFRISKRVDFRAVQFDYNPSRLGGETQHNFRVGVGIVIR